MNLTQPPRPRASFLLALSMLVAFPSCDALTLPTLSRQRSSTMVVQSRCNNEDTMEETYKGTWSRRSWLISSSAAVTQLAVTPAQAQKGPPPLSVSQAAAAVEYELSDAKGSVGRLQAAVDKHDFTALLDVTKTMDQSLRKQVVGQAKYYWADQTLATQLSNAITFDLIGINRNARAGQESATGVQQYLDALKQDLTVILQKTQEAAAATEASS